MNFIGIIPARYASTRFPGKPLAEILGKPMIQRVYEQSSKVFETVYVATDDDRIKDTVLLFGGNAVMTSDQHKSGTDRLAEAIEIINTEEDKKFDVIVNIQGDEPFIHTRQLKLIKDCFNDKNTQIATLVKPITDTSEIFNQNCPKVTINKNNEAIYFSRSPIPHVRGVVGHEWIKRHTFYKHIGIYAYRYEVLKEITQLEQSPLEIAESLEQLRWIENGYRIKAGITELESISIDTPEDMEKIKNFKL
ncbi:MAG: 3-deoxy-manno-octulosonate cytidylyltransferase [Bacteroidia bacterium]|nr:3-deoxy-manno-octulosonate cytidylyltransferase [Bacteroidia bacterium]